MSARHIRLAAEHPFSSNKTEQLPQYLQKCLYCCTHTVWHCRSWYSRVKHTATTYIPHTTSLMCFLAAQFCFASWIAISIQGLAAENTELLGLYIDGTSVSFSQGLSQLSKSPISTQEEDSCKGIVQLFSFIPITLHIGNLPSHEDTLEHNSTHQSWKYLKMKGSVLCLPTDPVMLQEIIRSGKLLCGV